VYGRRLDLFSTPAYLLCRSCDIDLALQLASDASWLHSLGSLVLHIVGTFAHLVIEFTESFAAMTPTDLVGLGVLVLFNSLPNAMEIAK